MGAEPRGTPDVPLSFCWPAIGARPLSFLGQVRICELPTATSRDLHLPSDGLLSFFYDDDEQPLGLEPTDRGTARVFLFSAVNTLARASAPSNLFQGPYPERVGDANDELSSMVALLRLLQPISTTPGLEASAS